MSFVLYSFCRFMSHNTRFKETSTCFKDFLSCSDLCLHLHCRCIGLLLHLIVLRNKNTHLLELPWKRDRPVAETRDNTQHSQYTSMTPAVFFI